MHVKRYADAHAYKVNHTYHWQFDEVCNMLDLDLGEGFDDAAQILLQQVVVQGFQVSVHDGVFCQLALVGT